MNTADRLQVATTYRPHFIQGYRGPWDLIQPINIGEFIEGLEPSVYFSVTESADRYYCLYCVFHWKDWSETGGAIGRWDTHKWDFEGVLRIIDKKSGLCLWVITVFHQELKFYRTNQCEVNIQAHGHGMTVGPELPAERNLLYTEYFLEDIEMPKRKAWMEGPLQQIFNPHVHMPWQWNHWLIRRRKGKETDGLIYRDPEWLLRVAREVGIIDSNMIEATLTRVKGSEI